MTFQEAIDKYLNAIISDYENYSEMTEIRKQMAEEFRENLRYEIGNKYIKILTKNFAHSFIVLKDTDKFAVGDILMSKTYKAPATNFARGNIFSGYNVRWTGACTAK
jgi:hypothetical protein